MHRKLVVATIAALMLGAPGCGSSKPLTSAELTRQASAICKERSAQIAVLRKQHARDFRGLIVAGVPVMTKSVDKLSKLRPPASAKGAYGRFVAIEQLYASQLKRVARGAKSRENHALIHEVWRVTEQLHITACQ